MMNQPTEVWDYDYPDMSQPHHPAHPDYLLHHPPPVVAAALEVINLDELILEDQPE